MPLGAKICGLTTQQAVAAAIAGGADFVGFVFFPASPRNIDIVVAAELAAFARGQTNIVALTVDASDELLDAIVVAVRPDYLQLHGHETPERTRHVRERYGLPIIKALPVAAPGDVEAAAHFNGAADIILFDAKPQPGAFLPGGNGLAFDWTLLEPLKGRFAFMLSGGLNPENVREAIRLTGASGVDVSSGVESAPGLKDLDRITRFLDAVHANRDALS